MTDNNNQDNLKKEYSAYKNYNKTISTPNYDVKSTLRINMQSVDSVNLNNMRRRNREKLKEDPTEKKEELIPEISEIYGNKENKEVSSSKTTNKSVISNQNQFIANVTKKIAPENLVAIITIILIIVFMILTFVLYNIFTS